MSLRNQPTRSGLALSTLTAACALAALTGRPPHLLAQPSDQRGHPQGGQQSFIAGTVVSQTTGEPIVGATVSITPIGAGAFTDERGRFRIETGVDHCRRSRAENKKWVPPRLDSTKARLGPGEVPRCSLLRAHGRSRTRI